MYVTLVHAHVKPEHIEDFIAASTANHEASVHEPGNLRFDSFASNLVARWDAPADGDLAGYRLYFNNYGREKYAMGLYAALPDSRKADRCSNCPGHCDGRCPFGVPIKEKLVEAHTNLMA